MFLLRASKSKAKPIELNIREATCRDAASVRAVFDAAFATLRPVYQPRPATPTSRDSLANAGSRIVAESQGVVVGTVQFGIYKRHFHVLGLAVHPRVQGQGVARALLDWIAEYAATCGYDLITLDTIKQTGNVAVFEKLGFRAVEETVANWCESERHELLHEVRMQRAVGPAVHSPRPASRGE